MVQHATRSWEITPPFALRPKLRPGLRDIAADAVFFVLDEVNDRARDVRPPLRPLVLGAVAALAFGFVFDIGPWSLLTGRLLGTADAQEASGSIGGAASLSEPSEADRAALRYFAREGDVDRLEAELRRLRALYPGWQPPRDLLDPQGDDAELQRIYDLVGAQRYAEARRAIVDRQQRDPTFEPPARLSELLDLADIREQLRQASDARNFAQVLAVAQANERILTCEDVDSVWRVGQAFAQTNRPQRAFDAYAYVIRNCTEQTARAASLQKAAIELDPSYVTRLFALGATGADGQNEFENARLDIIRGAIARGGDVADAVVPAEWLDILAEFARTGTNLEDAMLVGYYLYRQSEPAEAAQWFRFALDNGLGSDAAEGYIVALRATGERDDEFLAREVAYQWREQTPELMEAYLDAAATILTADDVGSRVIDDVEQATVDRFVPVVIGQRDANGAQALGWYAYNTCQFIIAEEWFISSVNWVPTEAAIYGLALTRLRLGDEEGFREVIAGWGPLYGSVRSLAAGETIDPADPVTGEADDPTDEAGIASVVCDPVERDRLRRLNRTQAQQSGHSDPDPLTFTQAGSLAVTPLRAPLAHRAGFLELPPIPRRSVVVRAGVPADATGRELPMQARGQPKAAAEAEAQALPLPQAQAQSLPLSLRLAQTRAPALPLQQAQAQAQAPLLPLRQAQAQAQTQTQTPAPPALAPQPSTGQAAPPRDAATLPVPTRQPGTPASAAGLPPREAPGERSFGRRAPDVPDGTGPQSVAAGADRPARSRVATDAVPAGRRAAETAGTRPADASDDDVTRRVRQGAATAEPVDEVVERIVTRPRTSLRTTSAGAGGSSAQVALSARNYGRCVALTSRAASSGTLTAADAAARGFCLLQLQRPVEAGEAFAIASARAGGGTEQAADAAYGSALAALATNDTRAAAVAATSVPLARPRRTELQIGILTQRAIAANRDGRHAEALNVLDQRNRIAPLQKDLMLLQGFLYRNAGDERSADRIFRALNDAGPTPGTSRALSDSGTAFIGSPRSGRGSGAGRSFR